MSAPRKDRREPARKTAGRPATGAPTTDVPTTGVPTTDVRTTTRRRTKDKAPRRRRDPAVTRETIREAALALIRQKGFDASTMRDIARAADVSLGLAYHYFESKEALALAFYGEHITRHHEETRRALTTRAELAERIEAALLIGIDVRAADRSVLLVMARTVLDASNPISLFSVETTALRERSIGVFREVADVPEVEETLREPLALALWALHLGVLLRFVHDASPGQMETRQLVQGASRLAAEVTTMLSLPFLDSMRGDVVNLLRQGGLLRVGPSEQVPRGTTSSDAPLDDDPGLADLAARPGGPERDGV